MSFGAIGWVGENAEYPQYRCSRCGKPGREHPACKPNRLMEAIREIEKEKNVQRISRAISWSMGRA